MPCTVHAFAVVQTNRFLPATAFVFKNVSPTAHVAGNTVPVLDGRVDPIVEKSISRPCLPRSTFVCPCAAPAIAVDTKINRIATLTILMSPGYRRKGSPSLDWAPRYLQHSGQSSSRAS